MNCAIRVCVLLIVVPFVNVFSRTLVVDPGNPDQVIIGMDAANVGEQAIIPITVITDESVDFINIPIAYDDAAVEYDSCVFQGPLAEYAAIEAAERPGLSMVTIFGWSNVPGDMDNPYMNTHSQPEVVAILYFGVLPGTPEDTYPLTITSDPVHGFLVFGDSIGTAEWVPWYQNGLIQVISEQGFADSVIVGIDTVTAGEQATVPITIQNDEDVSLINIPITFDTVNFSLVGYQLFGDIYLWDNVFIGRIPDTEIIAIRAQAGVGESALNTEGIPEVAIELYFATNPAAWHGNFPCVIGTDPITGPLFFRDQNSNEWVPYSRNGNVHLNALTNCDLRYDYLWAYGFCQSPSFNRRYACRIANNGANAAENVVLSIAFPSVFTLVSTSPVANVDGNEMTWNIGNMAAGGSSRVDWYVDIPAGIGGDTVVTRSYVTTTTNDINIANNFRDFVEIVGFSYDPNDKTVDPVGYGDAHYVSSKNALMYTVYFENSDSATLPATDILILDTLDAKLDWSTVVFGPMSHPDPCTAWVDLLTGEITLWCDSILLHPDSIPPEGEGFFSFSVQPKWNVATGDVIENKAAIRFDFNEWIAAPLIGSVYSSIDVSKPISRVLPLAEILYNPNSLEIFWEGNDGAGSGVAYYDIYVSADGGPFNLLIEHTTSTSSVYYPGEASHGYEFYSIATDNLGLQESAPPQPDAKVTILTFLPGDANGDHSFNGLDVVYLVAYLKGYNPPPNPLLAGDANGNCQTNGLDVTYMVTYLKGYGAPPVLGDCPE